MRPPDPPVTTDDEVPRGAEPRAEYAFTVFTATFNRAHTLPRLYQSLLEQTFQDFEWLIVDDGSSDGTADLVERWAAEAPFPIRYRWQPNAGKHVAHNNGVNSASGELFVSIDSDDEITSRGLEYFHEAWSALPAEEKTVCFGIWAHCKDETGAFLGDRFPVPHGTLGEIRHRFRVRGEKWSAQPTAILRRHLFPLGPFKFVPEGVVWISLDDEGRSIFIDRVTRVYWCATKRADQLSLAGLRPDYIHGYLLWYLDLLRRQGKWIGQNPVWFARIAAHLTRAWLHLRRPFAAVLGEIPSWQGRAIWFAAFPVGYALYLRDRLAPARPPAGANHLSSTDLGGRP